MCLCNVLAVDQVVQWCLQVVQHLELYHRFWENVSGDCSLASFPGLPQLFILQAIKAGDKAGDEANCSQQ